MTVPTDSRRFIWYYGMTPERFGSDGPEAFAHGSMDPTVGWSMCLRRIRQETELSPEVHMLTTADERLTYTVKGLDWVFHPISFTRLSSVPLLPDAAPSLLGYSPDLFDDVRRQPPALFGFYGVGCLGSVQLVRILRRHDVPYFSKVFRDEQTNLLHEYVYRHAENLWAEVSTQADAAKDSAWVDPESVITIPQGINSEYFYPPTVESGSEAPVVGFVGRLDERKNFLLALRAFERIHDSRPDSTFRVIGKYMDETYRETCETFIDDSGIRDAIQHDDYVPLEELTALYRDLDLLLFPSRRETFGRVLVEAMMSETPAVVLRGSKGPESIVTDGGDGVVTTEDDYVSEVLELVEDPSRRTRLATQAAATARERYSLDRIAEQFETFCLRVAGLAEGRPAE